MKKDIQKVFIYCKLAGFKLTMISVMAITGAGTADDACTTVLPIEFVVMVFHMEVPDFVAVAPANKLVLIL